MAVYSKLLLSTGGGIISSQQQAEQTHDTATVLIGLGGTGVHCIRTIKTQVYTRLRPDDPDAVVPAYSHIRFLGVDTTAKSKGGALSENPTERNEKADSVMALDDTEFFPIGNKQIALTLKNKNALSLRDDITWLDHDHIKVPDLGDAGAGGIRQVGRFMLMDRANDFLNKVEREITAAKMSLRNPRVNIHIFAGLSGGTGSGCFLDVCYMVRSIAERVGGVTVFGYCFLPDVNLSAISYEKVDIRNYVPKNGYAAMQELDYCMNLPQNGGSFQQVYQGHKVISWNTPPVDMCHLVCATDKENHVIPNAYDYAMHVVAEYVLDFLTYSNEEFGLVEHLSDFRAIVIESDAKKAIGAEMAYCAIGASCASIPLREINTYLASELFDKFGALRRNMPSKSDVEQLVVAALARDAQTISGVYDSLYREIREGAMGDYVQYPDDWKFVRDYGNHELVHHYTDQTAAQLNRAEANAQSMISSENQLSLLGRLTGQLYDVLRDIDRGPVYAYRMLSASESHNVLNIVDGLIADNTARWNQEAVQTDRRLEDYENAKADFETRRRRSLWDSDEKRFQSYEYYLMLEEQHKLAMEVYQRLDNVLRMFRDQVVEATGAYYIKLNRVMETLMDTFAENREALRSQNALRVKDNFAIPLMTIEELRKSLDAEIQKINVPSMLNSFMDLLLKNEEDWIMEDENKITRLVISFFVERAFQGFANRTITGFLRDKYENKYGGKVSDAQLTEYVYNDWMKLLSGKSSPLFYFNSSIWQESDTTRMAFVSFPSVSAPIKAAAEKLNSDSGLWGLKESALTDRIFFMCCGCGMPLSSYNNCAEYERSFYSAKAVGRHLYEGKPNPTIAFTDWNRLPSLTPQSVINVNSIPLDLANQLAEARQLYEKARAVGCLDEDSYVCQPSKEALENARQLREACQKAIDATSRPQDIPALEKALQDLEAGQRIPVERTGFSFPTDGHRDSQESILRIQEDHFVASPAIHGAIRAAVEELEAAQTASQALMEAARQKIDAIKQSGNVMAEYCDAVFTGVVAIEGRVVVYHQNMYGVTNDVILCMRGDGFPFSAIPLYQGFVTFQTLPQETRREIQQLVDDRVNADAPELYATGKALKDLFTSERVNAWLQLSSDFEQAKEIQEFIGELNKRFSTYCLQNGL